MAAYSLPRRMGPPNGQRKQNRIFDFENFFDKTWPHSLIFVLHFSS